MRVFVEKTTFIHFRGILNLTRIYLTYFCVYKYYTAYAPFDLIRCIMYLPTYILHCFTLLVNIIYNIKTVNLTHRAVWCVCIYIQALFYTCITENIQQTRERFSPMIINKDR